MKFLIRNSINKPDLLTPQFYDVSMLLFITRLVDLLFREIGPLRMSPCWPACALHTGSKTVKPARNRSTSVCYIMRLSSFSNQLSEFPFPLPLPLISSFFFFHFFSTLLKRLCITTKYIKSKKYYSV